MKRLAILAAGVFAAMSLVLVGTTIAKPKANLRDKAGLDGFEAWRFGPAKDWTTKFRGKSDYGMTIPITYYKSASETWLPGIVGIQVRFTNDERGTCANWCDEAKLHVYDTGFDPEKGFLTKTWEANIPHLDPGTRYDFRIFVEYKLHRYYGREDSFTTSQRP
jgi:hypothetical protein